MTSGHPGIYTTLTDVTGDPVDFNPKTIVRNLVDSIFIGRFDPRFEPLLQTPIRRYGFLHALALIQKLNPQVGAEIEALTQQSLNAAQVVNSANSLHKRLKEEASKSGILSSPDSREGDADVQPGAADVQPGAADELVLNEGEAILFRPDSGGFSVNWSTDDFAAWARGKGLGMAPGGSETPLTAAGMPLNIWARGRVAALDGDKTGIDGFTSEALLGLAVGVTDDLTLGAFGSLLAGDVDSARMQLDLETMAYGGGVYGSLRIFSALDLGLSAAYSVGDADVAIAGARGDYDFDRLGLSVSLSGQETVGDFLLTPGVSIDYTRDRRDGYVDSNALFVPGGTDEDVAISGGLNVSRTWYMEDGPIRSVAPWGNATLIYTFRDTKELTISATESEQADAFSANLGLGLNLSFDNGFRLGAGVGVLSLGQDTVGYFGQMRLTAPLN